MRHIYLFYLLFVFVSNHFCFAQNDQGNWGKGTKVEDYTIYSRFPPESNTKQIKLTGVIHANIKAITHVLETADEYPDWVYNCKESRLVHSFGPDTFTYYIRIHMPFPLSDRDVLIHASHSYSPDGNWHGKAVSTKDANIPEIDGIVRVKTYHVTWFLKPLGDEKTAFIYTINMDPGGYIPGWVTNLFLSEAPAKTIKDLEAHSQKYQSKMK